MPATPKMIGLAEDLIDRCGYDLNNYPLDDWTFGDVANLIDELKAELGWKE